MSKASVARSCANNEPWSPNNRKGIRLGVLTNQDCIDNAFISEYMGTFGTAQVSDVGQGWPSLKATVVKYDCTPLHVGFAGKFKAEDLLSLRELCCTIHKGTYTLTSTHRGWDALLFCQGLVDAIKQKIPLGLVIHDDNRPLIYTLLLSQ